MFDPSYFNVRTPGPGSASTPGVPRAASRMTALTRLGGSMHEKLSSIDSESSGVGRLKLVNWFLASDELGMMSSSLAPVRMWTARQFTSTTWPDLSPTWIQSSTSKGRSKVSISPENRLPSGSCNARPRTIEPTPRAAIRLPRSIFHTVERIRPPPTRIRPTCSRSRTSLGIRACHDPCAAPANSSTLTSDSTTCSRNISTTVCSSRTSTEPRSAPATCTTSRKVASAGRSRLRTAARVPASGLPRCRRRPISSPRIRKLTGRPTTRAADQRKAASSNSE